MHLFGKGKLFSEIFRNFAHVKKTHQSISIRMTGEKLKQDSVQQKLSEYLVRTGRRNTAERNEILEAARGIGKSFSMEDLAEAVSQRGVRVSQATLYNTVELLVDAGVLGRYYGTGETTYGILPCNRHHLVCLKCGRVKVVKDKSFSEVLRARHYSAFTASYFEMTVYGVCSTCARQAKKTNINTSIKK